MNSTIVYLWISLVMMVLSTCVDGCSITNTTLCPLCLNLGWTSWGNCSQSGTRRRDVVISCPPKIVHRYQHNPKIALTKCLDSCNLTGMQVVETKAFLECSVKPGTVMKLGTKPTMTTSKYHSVGSRTKYYPALKTTHHGLRPYSKSGIIVSTTSHAIMANKVHTSMKRSQIGFNSQMHKHFLTYKSTPLPKDHEGSLHFVGETHSGKVPFVTVATVLGTVLATSCLSATIIWVFCGVSRCKNKNRTNKVSC